MAGLRFTAYQKDITLASGDKTLLQLVAPSDQVVEVTEVHVSFDGVSATDAPANVEIAWQTTAGTMSSLTLTKVDPDAPETIQSTAQHTATSEPTKGGVIRGWKVHLQKGFTYRVPVGRDGLREILIPGGKRLGLIVNGPGTGRKATAYIVAEE